MTAPTNSLLEEVIFRFQGHGKSGTEIQLKIIPKRRISWSSLRTNTIDVQQLSEMFRLRALGNQCLTTFEHYKNCQPSCRVLIAMDRSPKMHCD